MCEFGGTRCDHDVVRTTLCDMTLSPVLGAVIALPAQPVSMASVTVPTANFATFQGTRIASNLL